MGRCVCVLIRPKAKVQGEDVLLNLAKLLQGVFTLPGLLSWQSGTPREGRHHQHQRRADRLSQRRERGYKRGRHPADSGEARQRGRDPHHRPRGDWTLKSHLTERTTDSSTVIQPRAGSQCFSTNCFKTRAPNRESACVDMSIKTTSFELLLSSHPPEIGLQLKPLTCRLSS